MYCIHCGVALTGAYCTTCGGARRSNVLPAPAVRDLLPVAILVTVLGCVYTGIPAIIYACRAQAAVKLRDFAAARRDERKAKLWCWISGGLGLLIVYSACAFALFVFLCIFINLSEAFYYAFGTFRA